MQGEPSQPLTRIAGAARDLIVNETVDNQVAGPGPTCFIVPDTAGACPCVTSFAGALGSSLGPSHGNSRCDAARTSLSSAALSAPKRFAASLFRVLEVRSSGVAVAATELVVAAEMALGAARKIPASARTVAIDTRKRWRNVRSRMTTGAGAKSRDDPRYNQSARCALHPCGRRESAQRDTIR